MLSDVQQLADKISGEKGNELNNARDEVVKASKMLQKTAEVKLSFEIQNCLDTSLYVLLINYLFN